MKRELLLAATLCILTSSALGVVGHNNTEGDMSITSSHGSAGATTTAVGPNGTKYSAKVSMDGRTQNDTEDRIRSETISSSKVKFKGTITAPTPCHVLEHEVNETEEKYVLNIKTVEEARDKVCAQVVTGINYNAEFEAENGFKLEVQHNGEKVKEFNTVSDKQDKNKTEKKQKSFLRMILSFFGL